MPTPPYLRLRSNKFLVQPEEGDHEGAFGQALGCYVTDELIALGYQIGPSFLEDWGWLIVIRGQRYRLDVCCYGASLEGELANLCILIDVGTWLAHLGLADPAPRVAKLRQDLIAVLTADPDIEYLGPSEHFQI